MNSDDAKKLEQTPFGASLTPRSCQRIAHLARHISLPHGQLLFREGADNPNVYLMLRGRVDLSMTIPGRGAIRILTVGSGDLVAWSAVLGDGKMTCSAQVQEDSELLALSGPQLKELMEQDHELGFEFMRVVAVSLSKRLVATRLQLLDLFTTDPSGLGGKP